MAINCLPFQKVKTVDNCPIIGITFLDVRMTGCEMRSKEAEARVVEV